MKKTQDKLTTVRANYKTIERKLQECTSLFQQNARLLALLTNGRAPVRLKRIANANERAILNALYNCFEVKIFDVPRNWLAVIARVSPRSGPYRSALAKVLKTGYVVKAGIGAVSLDRSKMTAFEVTQHALIDREQLIDCIDSTVFSPVEADTLVYLTKATWAESWIDCDELVLQAKHGKEQTIQAVDDLVKQGFIETSQVEKNLMLRATLKWFKPDLSQK